MPTREAGFTLPTREAGFTLIELMVALFVMALLAGAAVLALPGDDRALRHEAERFAVRASAARDEAITEGVPVALVVGARGYGFERRAEGGWERIADARFADVQWAGGTRASLGGTGAASLGADAVAQRTGQGARRLLFDEMGLAGGDIAVSLAHGKATASVHVTRDGKVSVDAPR